MAKDWQALYALQDWALALIREPVHGFHLTGGTALSRGYCGHRFSEDLDFFANDVSDFGLWRDRCLEALRLGAEAAGFKLEVIAREERFGRAYLRGETALRIEFVNDVPSRIGVPWVHPQLGLLDTRENILANKVSALLDREAPKDLADIYWLCCREGLDIFVAIDGAQGKAAGIFPPLVARALEKALPGAWAAVEWCQVPEEEEFERSIRDLAESIVAGEEGFAEDGV